MVFSFLSTSPLAPSRQCRHRAFGPTMTVWRDEFSTSDGDLRVLQGSRNNATFDETLNRRWRA